MVISSSDHMGDVLREMEGIPRERWHCSTCNTESLCLVIRADDRPTIHMCPRCEMNALAIIEQLKAEE